MTALALPASPPATVAGYLRSPRLQLANRLKMIFPAARDSRTTWREAVTDAFTEEIGRRRVEARSDTPYLGDTTPLDPDEREIVEAVQEFRRAAIGALLARGEEITGQKVSDENLPDLFERVTGPGYAGATAHAIAVIEDLPMALIETLRRTGEVDVERGLPFPDEADDRPTWCGVVKDGNGRKAVRTAGTDLLLDDDVWAAREDRLSAPKAGWQVNLMDGGSVEDERATALLAQHGHGPYMTARNMHDRTGETTARDPELVRRWLERYGNGSIEELALGVRKGWQYHADRREIREQKLTPAVLRIIREDRATRPEIAKALGCHHDTIYQIAPLPRKAVKVRPLPTVDAVECGYVRTIKARALAYAKFGLSVAAEWEGSPGGWLGSRRLPSPKPLENGDLQEDDTI